MHRRQLWGCTTSDKCRDMAWKCRVKTGKPKLRSGAVGHERYRALWSRNHNLLHSLSPVFLPWLWVCCAGFPPLPVVKTLGGVEEDSLADKEVKWKMLPLNLWFSLFAKKPISTSHCMGGKPITDFHFSVELLRYSHCSFCNVIWHSLSLVPR